MSAPPASTIDYRAWQRVTVRVADRPYAVATKPGVFAHGREDSASLLLAEHARVNAGDVVVHLNCGTGLFGVVAAERASRVLLADRNVLAVEAARRTIDAQRSAATVVLGHGASMLPAGVVADVVAIRIPHEKLALVQLLHDAFRLLRVGGRCYLAGATNEGAKSAAKLLERLFGTSGVVAHGAGHRVVVAIKKSETPGADADTTSPYLDPDVFHALAVSSGGHDLRLFTRPGVFSWDHLDEATAILADTMEIRPGDRVLDLGCGSGVLGTIAALRSPSGRVVMVDADVEAVRSATRTAAAAGAAHAVALTSDVAGAVLGERFDAVVTNPPFHVGKSTDLDVPRQFIHDAWEVLAPGGRLYLVANRTLPYERVIFQRFGNVEALHDGRRFKVLRGVRQ
jgi:16S rRNA (guanine1207-N2)-methyltransferase